MAERTVPRWVASRWFWVLALGSLFLLPVAAALRKQVPPPPPILYQLPSFELVDQFGRPYGSRDLHGKIWIANFIFTRCQTACPLLTQAMVKVQKRMRTMGDAVMLVSISVDPEHDTPERLKAYAEKAHAKPARWRFLTGDSQRVQEAVVGGFKLPMDPGQEAPGEATIFDITHGTRFVLVDQEGRIRGYYDADPEGIEELLYAVSLVGNLPAPAAGE